MPDLTSLSDAELDEQRRAVADETERRQRLALIPAEIARLSAQYAADGGDPADLAPDVPAADPAPASDPAPADPAPETPADEPPTEPTA